MASTYTPSLTLTQIGNGEQSGTWGTTTNTNWQLIEDAVAGVAQVSVSGTSGATLSVANGTTDQARKAVIVVTGSTSGTNAIVAPLEPKVYVISNQTTGGFNITIGASSGSVVTIPNGVTTLVYCDGTNFYSGITGFTGGNLSISGNITATGTITGATFATSGGVPQFAGGAANQIPYQTGANATSYITAPATDTTRYLSYIPGTGFSWQTSSTTASSLSGGTTNSLVYQSSPGVTQFFAKPGTSDTYYLTYNGVSNQFVWSLGGAVTSVTASAPLAATGGTAPNISMAAASPNLVLAGPSGGGSSATPAFRSLVAGDIPNSLNTTTINGVTSSTYNFSTYSSFFYTGGTVQLSVSGSGLNVLQTISSTASYFNQPALPSTDGGVSLGSSSFKWSAVWAVNGTIQTSDANQKTEIANLDAAEKRVATRLKGLIKKFKFKDAVAKKGSDGARIHVGVIAQEVGDAFTAEGLDPNHYGVFCYDEWDASDAILDKEGKVVVAAKQAGSSYGVRYDELFAFIISAL